MGPQASGKGTVGKMLSDKLALPLISVGDLLRSMPEGNPRAQEARELMAQGKLAPFELVADLIISRVSQDDCHDGYLLDGWARSMDNLNFFNPGFEKVLYLKLEHAEIIKRLSNRRTCSSCGAIYNIVSVPPKVEGICDKCGGTLVQREDDKEEAIGKRLSIFNNETLPVIEHFRKLKTLVEVDASKSPAEVFSLALEALNIKHDQY